MPSVAHRARARRAGHEFLFKPIAYGSPEPHARSPPSHPAAPSRTGCAAPRPSGARPRCAPGLHPALRCSSSLAHRLGPEGPSLRRALPSGRSGLARSHRNAPRIRPTQDTSHRPGAAGRSWMCTFVQVCASLPVRGLIVPDPRTSRCAVTYSAGVDDPCARFIVRALLETARCTAESGHLKVTRSHLAHDGQTPRRSGRIRVECAGKHIV